MRVNSEHHQDQVVITAIYLWSTGHDQRGRKERQEWLEARLFQSLYPSPTTHVKGDALLPHVLIFFFSKENSSITYSTELL